MYGGMKVSLIMLIQKVVNSTIQAKWQFDGLVKCGEYGYQCYFFEIFTDNFIAKCRILNHNILGKDILGDFIKIVLSRSDASASERITGCLASRTQKCSQRRSVGTGRIRNIFMLCYSKCY